MQVYTKQESLNRLFCKRGSSPYSSCTPGTCCQDSARLEDSVVDTGPDQQNDSIYEKRSLQNIICRRRRLFCGAVFIIHKNVCTGHAFLSVTLPLPNNNKMASKSKRKRKIAFAEEVDICDKKNKQFEDSQDDLRGDNQRSMNWVWIMPWPHPYVYHTCTQQHRVV